LATKYIPLSATVTRHHCCHKVIISTDQPVSAGQNCSSSSSGTKHKYPSCKKSNTN